MYKIGDKVEFFTEYEEIHHGEIFRIKRFLRKIYFIKTEKYVYKVKENNIIRKIFFK